MTQSVTNTLNNLQELIPQAKQEVSKILPVNDIVTTDKKEFKKEDFSKIFNKQLSKKNTDELKTNRYPLKDVSNRTFENKKTLSDVKSQVGDLEKLSNWADFKENLNKITEEANVETSLDLTLARDIEEIISQLKEAIDETSDETEDTIEKSAVVENITTQILSENTSFAKEFSINNNDNGTVDISENIKSSTNELISFKDANYQKNIENLNEKIVSNESTKIELENKLLESFTETVSEDSININPKNDTEISKEFSIDKEMLQELNIETIEGQTDSHSENSLMNNQTPEEQGLKAILNQDSKEFDLQMGKISNTHNANNVSQQTHKTVDVNPSKILEQISKQLEGLQNNSKVNIVLNPENLGKVSIQLIKTGEGLSAQLTVSSQEVRDLLMKGLDGLKDTLLTQGIAVDNVSIKTNETLKSEYNPDWTEQENSEQGKKEQRQSDKEEKEKGLFEKLMSQNVKNENGNV